MAVTLLEVTYLGQADELQELRKAWQVWQDVDRGTVGANLREHCAHGPGRRQQGGDREDHDREAQLGQQRMVDGRRLAPFRVVEQERRRWEGGRDRANLIDRLGRLDEKDVGARLSIP